MKKSRHSIDFVSFAAAALIAIGCNREAPAPPGSAATPGAPDATSELSFETLMAVLSDPDHFARARKLGELLPTVGPGGVPVVREALEQTAAARIELGAADYELLMHYWALHDPEEASSYAFGLAPRGYRVGAIHATVRPWMKADPENALRPLRDWGVEQGDYGAAVQIALVRGWYESGKPGLEEYIHDLGPSFERQRALGAYVTAMIRTRGADAAVSWAEAIPEADGAYRLDAFRVTGESLVPFDVDAAKRFCDAHCDGSSGAALRTQIATSWVMRGKGEGANALAWLATAPQNDETGYAVRRSFAKWGDLDRDGALSWLKSQVAGDVPAWLVPALPIYIRLLGQQSPEEGLAAATRFSEGTERDFWVVEIVRRWRQRDEAAAEAWIEKASLSAQVLEKVRAPQTRVEQRRMDAEAKRERILSGLRS